MKAGLTDRDAPTAVFPAVVGRAKHDVMMPGSQDRTSDCFVGEVALNKKGVLALTYPVSHGIVKDWTDMEKVWHHTFFDVLRVNPEEHPVVITEAPLNPKKNRERMLEMLFEKFSVPASYVVIQAVMLGPQTDSGLSRHPSTFETEEHWCQNSCKPGTLRLISFLCLSNPAPAFPPNKKHIAQNE
eukprot:644387-Amphidinium_carterae.1